MKKKRFTSEEIERANNINLMEYAANQGFKLKKVGTDSYKIEGYGGLYINPRKNIWNCFSQRKGGGPIQFVMLMKNKTWVDAVKELIRITPIQDLYRQKEVSKQNYKENKKEFILPEKNNTYKHMIAYLISTRKIDKDIVYKLIREGKLYEDRYRNCIFVGYNKKGIPSYASKRGTNANIVYRGDVKNSNKAYPFCVKGSSNKVYVYEAPIEVMSYLTLFKLFNGCQFVHHAISLGGLADVALDQYLKDNPQINEIVLCLNNDEAGINASNAINKKYTDRYEVKIEYPINKDFNEDLQNIIKKMEVIKEKDKRIEEKDNEEEFALEQ
ncbi:DUF3991 domain-containing protein [Xylanivirga thermophila]|uniref:DUF3991 domain-containing protein n=1 Tax=Xylanivirga thermophila TaxID=2496273 RepID=UPI00101C7D3F|nr:DUF3991 domain-containing protein [Xylanivirga thermophila]